MTYLETVEYMYAQLPMFSQIGAAAYKKDLHNTLALCAALDNPHKKFKSIHIAGTNGKGSTSHFLAAILQEAGYKTGLYTSPHLMDFRERIRINGEPINEQFVVGFVEQTKTISEEIQPSFFELTVAMAFQYFAENKVDIAIIEAGMGGLLDSTNVITPILSVITNIGYDHQQILGETLPEIAQQKAGIIKPGVPVVIGETTPETRPVFLETAKKENAQACFAEEDFITEYIEPLGNLLLCNIKSVKTGIMEKLRLGLIGIYQAKNAATVLAAVHELRALGFEIGETPLHRGMEHVAELTGLRGRWEILQNHPHVVVDVAHNADGIAQIIQQVNSYFAGARMHFVLGFVKDKKIDNILPLFPDNSRYFFTNAHMPRALSAIELQEKAKTFNLKGEAFDDVNAALDAALAEAAPHDIVVVCGSFFIVAELKAMQTPAEKI